jgi:hypothetical protein
LQRKVTLLVSPPEAQREEEGKDLQMEVEEEREVSSAAAGLALMHF